MFLTPPQIVVIHHIQVVKFLNVASLAILVYDYLLTFKLEVAYAWGRKWSLVDVLFFITRYMPFVDTSISIYSQLVPGLGRSTCQMIYQFNGWSFTVAMGIAEVILTIRTWSLYNRGRKLGGILIAFFVSCWAVIFLMMGTFLETSKAMDFPIPEQATCFGEVGDRLYVCWCLLMVYDGGIMILMLVQALTVYWNSKGSPLLNVLYIDGISYYVFLFVLSLVNVVVILTLPKDFVNLFSTLERVFHSILTGRVILHVREQAAKTSVSDSFVNQDLEVLKSDHGEMSPMCFTLPGDIPIPRAARKRRMTVADDLECGVYATYSPSRV